MNRGLLAGATLLALAGASQGATFGPDSYGYIGIDSQGKGGINFNWQDIVPGGTLVANGDDVSSISSALLAPVTLAVPFEFYGQAVSQFVPTTNGYLTTDLTDTGLEDLTPDWPLPAEPSSPTDGKRIYVLHHDLEGQVYYQYNANAVHPTAGVLGASIFQWEVSYVDGEGPFSFQALLFNNGDMLMQFAGGDPGSPDGINPTTGIQNNGAFDVGLGINGGDEGDPLPDDYAVLITRIPTPGSLGLLGIAGVAALRRRR
jgi:hypothetical protein